jgi:hypothetical protein
MRALRCWCSVDGGVAASAVVVFGLGGSLPLMLFFLFAVAAGFTSFLCSIVSSLAVVPVLLRCWTGSMIASWLLVFPFRCC